MLELFWNLKYSGAIWEEQGHFSQKNNEMVGTDEVLWADK